MTDSVLSQSPEQAIRQVGDELRARAKLQGSFLKPVTLQFGPWGLALSYGTAAQMAALVDMENQERSRQGLPLRPRHLKPQATWQFSVRLLIDGSLLLKDAHAQLGMMCAAVGMPGAVLMKKPVETLGRDGESTIMNWQWTEPS